MDVGILIIDVPIPCCWWLHALARRPPRKARPFVLISLSWWCVGETSDRKDIGRRAHRASAAPAAQNATHAIGRRGRRRGLRREAPRAPRRRCCLRPRPRAKRAVDQAPGGKTFFRRVGMNARWRLAVSVGGFWLCSGRPDHKNPFLFSPGASGLVVFLSLTSCTIFGTVLKSTRQQPGFGLPGLACHAKSKSVEF